MFDVPDTYSQPAYVQQMTDQELIDYYFDHGANWLRERGLVIKEPTVSIDDYTHGVDGAYAAVYPHNADVQVSTTMMRDLRGLQSERVRAMKTVLHELLHIANGEASEGQTEAVAWDMHKRFARAMGEATKHVRLRPTYFWETQAVRIATDCGDGWWKQCARQAREQTFLRGG